MAVESFFTRWRKAVRSPERETPNAALLAHRRRQRKLIYGALGMICLLGVGGYVYSYVASAPDRARAEAAWGVRQMGPGNYEEAIRHFDRAIGIWPEFAEAYMNRGVAKHNVSQRLPALADLDKALDLDPGLALAYSERGQIYLENGDGQRAVREFSKSLNAKATLDGYYQRAEAYEKLGEHQKAILDFDAAIGEFREAPYAYRARAVAKRNLGDREGADADDEKAQRIETGHSVERDVLLAP